MIWEKVLNEELFQVGDDEVRILLYQTEEGVPWRSRFGTGMAQQKKYDLR